MTTQTAVVEMVNAAFRHFGGVGDAGTVIIHKKERIQRMRIYLSGAISKIPYEEAFELFEHAERIIENFGHEPVNPMKSAGEYPGKPWSEYMAEDIMILDACDAIFMLQNWRDSDGARIEHYIAAVRGKQIFYQATEIPANV